MNNNNQKGFQQMNDDQPANQGFVQEPNNDQFVNQGTDQQSNNEPVWNKGFDQQSSNDQTWNPGNVQQPNIGQYSNQGTFQQPSYEQTMTQGTVQQVGGEQVWTQGNVQQPNNGQMQNQHVQSQPGQNVQQPAQNTQQSVWNNQYQNQNPGTHNNQLYQAQKGQQEFHQNNGSANSNAKVQQGQNFQQPGMNQQFNQVNANQQFQQFQQGQQNYNGHSTKMSSTKKLMSKKYSGLFLTTIILAGVAALYNFSVKSGVEDLWWLFDSMLLSNAALELTRNATIALITAGGLTFVGWQKENKWFILGAMIASVAAIYFYSYLAISMLVLLTIGFVRMTQDSK